MADVTAIRHAIADALLAVYGPDGPEAELGITVTAFVESPPNAPALQVLKGQTDYDYTLNLHNMLVRALFRMPADEEAQGLLDDLLSYPGDRSIKSALEVTDAAGETTLDGKVGSITVQSSTGHRIYQIAGIEYLGADFNCEVYK